MTHVLPAARPLHTALAFMLLFGGTLAVQFAVSRMPAPDPWPGLARSSERARAVVDALRPCEQALEDANGARRAGSTFAGALPAACHSALMAVHAAALPEACQAAATGAADAASALARGEDAAREVSRYRAARTRCLAEVAA
jgi:hypothetical protein